jgi:hypothetical protein
VANEAIGVEPSRAALVIPARTLRVGFVYGACLMWFAMRSANKRVVDLQTCLLPVHPYWLCVAFGVITCVSHCILYWCIDSRRISYARAVFQVSLAVAIKLAQQTAVIPSLVSTSTVAFVVQPSDLVARIAGGDRTFWCVFFRLDRLFFLFFSSFRLYN